MTPERTGARARVAAVQTVSGGDVAANLAAIEPLVVEAARRGAQLVLLPEYFGIFGARATDKVAVREIARRGRAAGVSRARRARAAACGSSAASVPIAIADPGRVRSACLVFDPEGQRVARYDKMHLFAFTQGDERYDEGTHHRAGRESVLVDAPCGRVGLSVCYDVRFPELYRQYGDAVAARGPLGVHRGDRCGALAPAAARARGREPVLRARRGAGRLAPQRPAHLRPQHARRSVGRDRAPNWSRAQASSWATSIQRASRQVRRDLPALVASAALNLTDVCDCSRLLRRRTEKPARGYGGQAPRAFSSTSTAPPPPACAGASQ